MTTDPKRDLRRLQHFYGAVASDQNRSILQLITGEKILELGCGYGTLAQEAKISGKEVIGLDIDLKILELGRSCYPSLVDRLVQGDMGSLPFKNKSFHTVILRESLHHVSWEKVLSEVVRVCRKEIIIFEPNPNWFLRTCRKIISHQDQEIPLKPLLKILERRGIIIKGLYFRDLIAFPLSGGFVGWEFIPPVRFLFPPLLWADRMLQNLFRILKMEELISWRYLVKGILNELESRG